MNPLAPALACFALVTACDSAPEDLRTWRPSDHGHSTESAAVAPTRSPGTPPPATVPAGLDDVTVVTWRRNCTSCHGQLGRGDGPQAAMTKPRDLSDPAWQDSVDDERIATSIRRGRGSMPGFALPDSTIAGLVRLVRLFDARGPNASASARAGSVPPPDTPDGGAR